MAQRQDGGLQIEIGTEEEIKALIEKISNIHQHLKWFSVDTPTDDGFEQIGCKILFDDVVVELSAASWWGVRISQYKTWRPSNFLLYAVVHNSHSLYPQINAIFQYAWRQSGA